MIRSTTSHSYRLYRIFSSVPRTTTTIIIAPRVVRGVRCCNRTTLSGANTNNRRRTLVSTTTTGNKQHHHHHHGHHSHGGRLNRRGITHRHSQPTTNRQKNNQNNQNDTNTTTDRTKASGFTTITNVNTTTSQSIEAKATEAAAAAAAAAAEIGSATEGIGSAATAGAGAAEGLLPPTARQLTMHALRSAVPMIGFGFMDNTIMIHAGHYVDCTLGVTFSLSTLAAAGIGQIFSGIGGVMFGDALDTAFRKISGSTKMSPAQRIMKSSRIAGLTGGIVGVTLGCVLGLVNLLFVDEHKASLLKLQALEEGQEFEFEVEVDNELHPGYTTVIVRGPDVDGVLASITACIASIGCSVVELHASPRRVRRETTEDENYWTSSDIGEEENNDDDEDAVEDDSTSSISALFDQLVSSHHNVRMEDMFLIKDRSTQQAIDNDDLDTLARAVLAAAKDPLNSHSLKAQVDELQMENIALADRVSVLEGLLEEKQIRVVPSSTSLTASEANKRGSK